jgi:hypothetical protein
VRAVPCLCRLYPGICLTTEKKSRKNLSQGSFVLDKSCRQNQNKHCMSYNLFFLSKIMPFIRECGKNVATDRHAREGNIIRRKRIEYYITKATYTLSEYAIFIYCFSTTTKVARTRLKCYVIRTLPVLLQIKEDNQSIAQKPLFLIRSFNILRFF